MMVERGGFDVFVCNPPFMGGKSPGQHPLSPATQGHRLDNDPAL